MTASAYPLDWPDGWPRTKPHMRGDGRSRFKRGDWRAGYRHPTLEATRTELADELEKLGARNVILSTNVRLRIDGHPYSNDRVPEDPGIAVYFTLDGEHMVMAQDAFQRVPENVRSLTLAVAGMRQMQRHGGGTMLKRAFRGFTALPPPTPGDGLQPIEMPGGALKPWWEVLGVARDAPWPAVKGAYRGLVKDAGGASTEINAAMEAAKKDRGEA